MWPRKDNNDIERVQKAALRLILGEKYKTYNVMKRDSLEMRRENLCLKFAKQCLRNGKLKAMFPKSQNRHDMEKRSGEKYIVNKAFTERYRRSAIPNMQRLLNNSEKEKIKIFKRIPNSVSVRYDFL